MHLNSNNTTRVAQPPGGRTSFIFSDGSDNRRMVAAPEPQRVAVAMQQPPGGRANFEFDDSISRGDGADRRHTNGLRRLDRQPTPWAPSEPAASSPPRSYHQQPPGGRSNFVLNDNFTGAYDRVAPHQAVNSYRQPPGGASNFVLNDNSAGAHDYMRGAPPPPPPVPSYEARGSYRQPPGGSSGFSLTDGSLGDNRPIVAARSSQQQDALEEFVEAQRSQPQSAHSQSSGVGHHRSTLAPPGGHSSFSLGWGGDDSGNHHRHAGRMASHPLVAAMPGGSAMDRGRGGYAGLDATERAKPPPYAPIPMASSIPPIRSSTYVAAPPGGQSSFVFG